MVEEDDVTALLPLTPLSLHVLVALAQGAAHGYAVIKAVERSSQGTVAPGAGTFYSAIARMRSERLLEEVDSPPAASPGRLRRTFQLTDLGRVVLRAEVARLQRLVDEARAADAATTAASRS